MINSEIAKLPNSEVVISREVIQAAVTSLAEQINRRCSSGNWTILCVMNGGLVFTADLMRRLEMPMRLDFVRVGRYAETTRAGDLNWFVKPQQSLRDTQVLIVDDIFDEGDTVADLVEFCHDEGAAEVLTCVMFKKEHGRQTTRLLPDFVGLPCPDYYVFGYGMDYEGYYRNLADVHALLAE